MTGNMLNGLALVLITNPIPHQLARSAMNVTKLTAWICIFTSGLLGCTSTTLIQPEGENQEKLNTAQIESVVTKDGKRYEFEGNQKGTSAAGMVRGMVDGKAVAIPLSEIDKMQVSESNTVGTILLVVGVVVVVGLIIVAASGGGKPDYGIPLTGK